MKHHHHHHHEEGSLKSKLYLIGVTIILLIIAVFMILAVVQAVCLCSLSNFCRRTAATETIFLFMVKKRMRIPGKWQK